MAAVSIPPSPHSVSVMSGHRVPLSNMPNAANSPYRGLAQQVSKRPRSQSTAPRDQSHPQEPPTKRQMTGHDQINPVTPPRPPLSQTLDGRLFGRKPGNPPLTAFERKLMAAREKNEQQKLEQQKRADMERKSQENIEVVRQWQMHYRKVFPKIIFYFESVPQEARSRLSRQVALLGAREEKFFSKEITHVITTRPMPTEQSQPPPLENCETSPNRTGAQTSQGLPKTINPSLLERSSHTNAFPSKSKYGFEGTLSRKSDLRPNPSDVESRRQQGASGDVLVRAKDMGMKIWAVEKLQRMMTTIFDMDTGAQAQHSHNTRSHQVSQTQGTARSAREADLSQLLRNERLNGPSDRDPTVASREMIPFKGPFIYVRDLEDKLRPIMIREYPKVSSRDEGEWPQFGSVSDGRCPFVKDGKRDQDAHKARPAKLADRDGDQRAKKAIVEKQMIGGQMQPPPTDSEKQRALNDTGDMANRNAVNQENGPPSKLFEPPTKAADAKRDWPHTTLRQLHSQHTSQGAAPARFFGGEPIASGVQPSNITSAIRSQMISSTAAAPGPKAGTSKEVYELKRKVLDKKGGPPCNGSLLSQRMNGIATTATGDRRDTSVREAKVIAQRKLGVIGEHATAGRGDGLGRPMVIAQNAKAKKAHSEKRELKPGYCENCREKFDHFEEHILSRKHRKFAINNDNWSELDALLTQLSRPLRDDIGCA